MVERLQRELLGAQRQPSHGIEARRVDDARVAARAVAVALQHYVGVELGGDLFGVERVAQELPHAGAQRRVVLRGRGSQGGDHEQRRARAHVRVVAQRAARGEGVHVGEGFVQRHQIRRRSVRLLEQVGAGVRAAHGVPPTFSELR